MACQSSLGRSVAFEKTEHFKLQTSGLDIFPSKKRKTVKGDKILGVKTSKNHDFGHVFANSESKWFVGSSSSRTLGFANKALAKATRMRQPPLSSRVGRRRSSSWNPKPRRFQGFGGE